MVEDGERVDQLVRVIGALFLHCIRGLATSMSSADYPADLDPPEKGGPIKNIGLMLGNMCSLADAHVDMGGWDESIVG